MQYYCAALSTIMGKLQINQTRVVADSALTKGLKG